MMVFAVVSKGTQYAARISLYSQRLLDYSICI